MTPVNKLHPPTPAPPLKWGIGIVRVASDVEVAALAAWREPDLAEVAKWRNAVTELEATATNLETVLATAAPSNVAPIAARLNQVRADLAAAQRELQSLDRPRPVFAPKNQPVIFALSGDRLAEVYALDTPGDRSFVAVPLARALLQFFWLDPAALATYARKFPKPNPLRSAVVGFVLDRDAATDLLPNLPKAAYSNRAARVVVQEGRVAEKVWLSSATDLAAVALQFKRQMPTLLSVDLGAPMLGDRFAASGGLGLAAV